MNYLKNWVLSWQWVTELVKTTKEQERVTAFKYAQDDLKVTFKGDVEERAEELSKDKLSALLSLVDHKKVVTLDKNTRNIYIGGELATPERLNNLKSEALFLSESELWRIIHETPKELAQKAMFISGESIDDMKKGRAMLYTLDSQKKVLEVFKNYQPSLSPTKPD